jgi:hypothetical protein
VLVRAHIIHNAAALLAEDHVGVEAARMGGLKVANPGYSFPSEVIEIGIVSDGEWD